MKEPEDTVDRCIKLFSYIDEKDVFLDSYKSVLAKRLLDKKR